MNWNNCEIRVLVKGRPVTEYAHMGNVFIEGREGSDFEIEFINRNAFRVEAVISVDGLSVLDGKDAGVHSSGYLVDGNSSIRIPGWKLNEQQAASFFFSGKGESYATQATGAARNNGVIGAMVFKEKVNYSTYSQHNNVFRGIVKGTPHFSSGASAGGYVMGSTADMVQQWNSTRLGASSLNDVTASCASDMNNSVGRATFGGTNASLSPTPRKLTKATTLENTATAETASVNNLGTGFGAAQTFATSEVSFTRADLLGMVVIYYDNMRGLKARGVPVPRKAYRVNQQTPQAFPGMNVGCAPPPGWKG